MRGNLSVLEEVPMKSGILGILVDVEGGRLVVLGFLASLYDSRGG